MPRCSFSLHSSWVSLHRIWSGYSPEQARNRAQISLLGLNYMDFWFCSNVTGFIFCDTVRLFILMECLLKFCSPIESECWHYENELLVKKPNCSSVRRQGSHLSSEATHCGCLISQGTQWEASSLCQVETESRNEGEPIKICLGALEGQRVTENTQTVNIQWLKQLANREGSTAQSLLLWLSGWHRSSFLSLTIVSRLSTCHHPTFS